MSAKFKTPASLCLACSLLVSVGCSTTPVTNSQREYYVPGAGWVSASSESQHIDPGRTFHFDWGKDSFWQRNQLRSDVEAYTMSISPYTEGEVVSALIEHSSLSDMEAKDGTCYFQLNILLRIVNHLPSGEIIKDRLIPLKSDAIYFRSSTPACYPSSLVIGSALHRAFGLYEL